MICVRADVIAVAIGDALHLHYTAREYISSIRGFDKTIGLKLCKEYKNELKAYKPARFRSGLQEKGTAISAVPFFVRILTLTVYSVSDP